LILFSASFAKEKNSLADYDAVTVTPIPPSGPSTFPHDLSFDTTIFSIDEDAILPAALELASVLKEKHYYTDVANFSLKCEICGAGLVGEKDA
jgi:ubiquitin thioesterase OTU1